MGFGYWWWRTCKTVFFITCYYMILFASGFFKYPQNEPDMSRGSKYLIGMNQTVILLFIACSIIVILFRVLRKKSWVFKHSILLSYITFSISHFTFITFMGKYATINYTDFIIPFVFFTIISVLLGQWLGRNFVSVYDELDEYEYYDEDPKEGA